MFVGTDVGTERVATGTAPTPPIAFGDVQTWIAYGLVLVAAFVAWGIYEAFDPDAFVPVPGIGMFAVLYIVAQALERILEPFAPLVAKTKEGDTTLTKSQAEGARNIAAAAAETATDPGTAGTQTAAAAQAQAAMDRARRNATLWIWALATCIALIVSGWIGLRMLSAVGVKDAPLFLDLLVTGLAIGGGTKPLHDLITNIQKAKEKKEDSPASA